QSISVQMVDGGFDPVQITGGTGDELNVEIAGAAKVLLSASVRVPRRRPPTIVRTDPPNGKTDVPFNTRIVVVFSEPIRANTIPTSVQLFEGGEPVGGAAAAESSGLVATFTPASQLAPNTEYSLVITTSVRDLAGDRLQQGARVSFTTAGASVTAPEAAGRIAFVSDRDGPAQLYRINLDGSGLTRLTHDAA